MATKNRSKLLSILPRSLEILTICEIEYGDHQK